MDHRGDDTQTWLSAHVLAKQPRSLVEVGWLQASGWQLRDHEFSASGTWSFLSHMLPKHLTDLLGTELGRRRVLLSNHITIVPRSNVYSWIAHTSFASRTHVCRMPITSPLARVFHGRSRVGFSTIFLVSLPWIQNPSTIFYFFLDNYYFSY